MKKKSSVTPKAVPATPKEVLELRRIVTLVEPYTQISSKVKLLVADLLEAQIRANKRK